MLHLVFKFKVLYLIHKTSRNVYLMRMIMQKNPQLLHWKYKLHSDMYAAIDTTDSTEYVICRLHTEHHYNLQNRHADSTVLAMEVSACFWSSS